MFRWFWRVLTNAGKLIFPCMLHMLHRKKYFAATENVKFQSYEEIWKKKVVHFCSYNLHQGKEDTYRYMQSCRPCRVVTLRLWLIVHKTCARHKVRLCFSYVGETSCVRAKQQRRHQHPTDVSSCHGDGYVRCVMSLVQAGADVSRVWQTFIKTFPSRRTTSTSHPITFQQMVVCEVLTQVQNSTVL